jgi:hypothetical protein
MGLRDFIQTRARQIQFVLVCLMGAGIATSSAIYFNTLPRPHPQALVGYVIMDLKRLDYRVTYEDLQLLGLFAGKQCGKCDFVRGGKNVNLDDLDDHSFMTTLVRYQRYLYLNFYSADAPTGQQRFDAVARKVRTRFPGRSNAIRIFRGARGEEEITAE